MNLKKAVATAGVGVGAIAAANAVLSRRAEPLAPPLPGEQHTYRWRGMDVSYTEAGDPDAPDLLFLHGINAAGTSHEWREIFEPLSKAYHVIAPDLPGYGLSDRPPLVYTSDLYTDFVTDFVRDVTENPTVIASSLSGAYATGAAKQTEVERLILVCPTTTSMPGGRKPFVRTVMRAPLVGTALFNAMASNPSLEYFSADHGYYDMAGYSHSKQEYQWQTTHQPGARYAPASFLSGYLDADMDLVTALGEVDAPVTLVWGREADTTPLAEGRRLADATGAKLVVIDYAMLVPHDEHPDKFVEAIDEDLPEISAETFQEERKQSLEKRRQRDRENDERPGDVGVTVENERASGDSSTDAVEIDVEETGEN